MRRAALVAVAALAAAALLAAAAAKKDDFEYAYDSYYDEKQPPVKDASGYYADDDALYYEDYGYYADDPMGYDSYYSGGKGGSKGGGNATGGGKGGGGSGGGGGGLTDCVLKGGKPQLKPGIPPCAVKLSGVDKHADLLRGGADGLYRLASCHNGRPLYIREKSPKGEDRVLWYSTGFGDWDVSNGTLPNEAEILMYGGDTQRAVAPLFVDEWHLGADLKSDSNMGDDDYFPVPGAKVACADGKKYEEPAANEALERRGPALSDAEVEAKYRAVFEKYGRRPEPNPAVNFSFIVLLVLVGLSTVLAIPYMLVQRRGGRGYEAVGGAGGGGGGLAQVIQSSRKKQSGHIN